MRTLATITGEGFTSTITEYDDGRVEFLGDADIDADGANGQNGGLAAYRVDNKGSEHLANGGMRQVGSGVEPIASWYKDIVLTYASGKIIVLPSGIIPSKTAYKFPGLSDNDPAAYVDSETVPYIVVPPVIIQKTKGVVKGCRARATHTRTGKQVEGIVADVGPRTKVGEVSIAMARSLGLNPSPRNGGESRQLIKYELWPDEPGKVCGVRIALMRSNGEYIV